MGKTEMVGEIVSWSKLHGNDPDLISKLKSHIEKTIRVVVKEDNDTSKVKIYGKLKDVSKNGIKSVSIETEGETKNETLEFGKDFFIEIAVVAA